MLIASGGLGLVIGLGDLLPEGRFSLRVFHLEHCLGECLPPSPQSPLRVCTPRPGSVLSASVLPHSLPSSHFLVLMDPAIIHKTMAVHGSQTLTCISSPLIGPLGSLFPSLHTRATLEPHFLISKSPSSTSGNLRPRHTWTSRAWAVPEPLFTTSVRPVLLPLEAQPVLTLPLTSHLLCLSLLLIFPAFQDQSF